MKITKEFLKEKRACENWFKKRGYTIASNNNDTSNGIDLLAVKDNKYFTVEIKKACKSTRCYRTTPLQKSGKASDYVAIITPKNTIIFQTVREHDMLCSKSGYRDVTKLVRIYDL